MFSDIFTNIASSTWKRSTLLGLGVVGAGAVGYNGYKLGKRLLGYDEEEAPARSHKRTAKKHMAPVRKLARKTVRKPATATAAAKA